MTPTEAVALEAGHKLNRLVAEYMGLGHLSFARPYSADIAACEAVVDRLKDARPVPSAGPFLLVYRDGGWQCGHRDVDEINWVTFSRDYREIDLAAEAPTLPLAVCRYAALLSTLKPA